MNSIGSESMLVNFYFQDENKEILTKSCSSKQSAYFECAHNPKKDPLEIQKLGVDLGTQTVLESRFLRTVEDFLSTHEGIQTLIYTYPLFTTEGKLFETLQTCKKERVYKFLCELVLNGFPNGIEQMTASIEQLKLLTKVLEIKTPTALENRIAQDILPQHKLLPKSVVPQKVAQSKEILQSFWNEGQITARDAYLVQLIGLKEVKGWLENEKEIPEIIKISEEIFSRTTESIAFQIVSELDGVARSEIILKFLDIACSLLKSGNFNGAMQISKAFSQPAVAPFWRNLDFGSTTADRKLFALFCSPTSNYSNYRDEMKEFEMTNRNAKLCLPVVSILFDDLKSTYGRLVNCTDPTLNQKDLKALAENVQLLMNFRKVKRNHEDHYIPFWLGLEKITREILLEYSFLCIGGRRWYVRDLPKDLISWGASDLVRYLVGEIRDSKMAIELFAQSIYDGKRLLEKLDQDKHFMDNWRDDIRGYFMQLHLEHVKSCLYSKPAESKLGINYV